MSSTLDDGQSHKSVHRPSSRNFHLAFRSDTPSISVTDADPTTHSLNPSAVSLSQRCSHPTTPQSHARALSLNSLYSSTPGTAHTPEGSISGSGSRKPAWKWRPSVLGHLSYSLDRHVKTSDFPPRASTSSTASCATPTTTTEFTDGMSCIGSLRSRAPTPSKFTAESSNASPSPSVWSLPLHQLHLHKSPGAASTPAIADNGALPLRHKQSSLRLPFTPKTKTRYDTGEPLPNVPQIVYSANGPLPRVSFASPVRNKKKKKLIISGIGVNDTRGFEGVKRWCEVRSSSVVHPVFLKTCTLQSFGELHHITRMPNNDLHVHFKKAEVADTVRVTYPIFLHPVH